MARRRASGGQGSRGVLAILVLAALGLVAPSGGGGAAAQAPAGPPAAGSGLAARLEGDPREHFAAANRLYEEGRFGDAAATYGAVAAAGYVSSTLYFNLANALLKAGQLGEAIVYYERARALAPRAEDIRVNLAYARSLTVDVLPETGGSAFLGGLVRIKDSLSAAEALLLAAAAWWMTAGALALARVRPGLRRFSRVLLASGLLALLVCGGLAAIKVHEAAGSRRAFIVIPEVAVRSGPGETFTARFTLHEGTGIEVLRAAGDWTEIQLTATINGWVPRESLLDL
jgi:tetratricopeptide (TPR) repeat protein